LEQRRVERIMAVLIVDEGNERKSERWNRKTEQ
jgi:hypothetical protein